MEKIIKNYEYDDIKKKLYILYLLNLTDLVFTFFLLNTGMFFEANYIMSLIIENNFISILLKGVMVFILIYFISKRIKKASKVQRKISNIFIMGCIFFYVTINISHIIWIGYIIKIK